MEAHGDVDAKQKMKSIKDIATYIKSDACKNIAVLTGAGISVASGIPDFRSPGGMYDTLRPELLTATEKQRREMAINPSFVVSWDLFQFNQLPYMELRRPFILGIAENKWKPTLGHFFFKVLDDKKMLRRLYTQNIDGLDYQLDIPREKIVSCHGTLGLASCEFCGAEFPMDELCDEIKAKIKDIYDETGSSLPRESSNILCENCKRPGVKPSTVLYGRSLPEHFFTSADEDFPENVDLLLIAGTSLMVGPANGLVRRVENHCKRVLINREKVGMDLGLRFDSKRDFFLPGDCDDSLLLLAEALGWKDDLEEYAHAMAPNSSALLS